jgi:hypothetical protein
MREWVTAQLTAEGARPVVVIDPDAIVTSNELEAAFGDADVYSVRDWFELRQAWELHGRHPDGHGPRVVIVTHDLTVGSPVDLPFDIEQASDVRRVRIPGPSTVRAAVVELDDEASDLAVQRVDAGSLNPVDAVLTAVAGLPSLGLVGSAVREFQAALHLIGHAQPRSVLELARETFEDPLARALLDDPPRVDEVQRAWGEWLADPVGSGWAAHMHECRAELIDLFMAGRLTPVPEGDADVPLWATVGIAQESPGARVAALLADPPAEAASLDDWVRIGQWWGEVRSGLAQVNPSDADLEARAWDWWAETDQRFLEWLRASYGSQLTRAWANWPASLDKVQPFLAKRQASAGKVLLLILDGMGFTQWTRIRELSSVRVARSGGVLAMLPTLTEVSRQAIAAAGPPIQFADSLRSTSKEPQRWASSWGESGASTAWIRIDGARTEELSAVPFGASDVIGLVLSATDELMHSAELLGDLGLNAGLEAWVRSGVFAAVLDQAAVHGYETWLTADHGNLAVEPAQEPREGAFVERAGTRARRYASRTLRDDASVEGVAWDALPGYPSDESERLLFAPGRTGWGPSRLSHGGLSLDEVIVPLVQIESAS